MSRVILFIENVSRVILFIENTSRVILFIESTSRVILFIENMSRVILFINNMSRVILFREKMSRVILFRENMSRVILFIEVRKLRVLFVHIYIWCVFSSNEFYFCISSNRLQMIYKLISGNRITSVCLIHLTQSRNVTWVSCISKINETPIKKQLVSTWLMTNLSVECLTMIHYEAGKSNRDIKIYIDPGNIWGCLKFLCRRWHLIFTKLRHQLLVQGHFVSISCW